MDIRLFTCFQFSFFLTLIIQDTILVVSDIFENISQNSGNIENYLTESGSGSANNQFFLNFFIKC